MYNEERKIRFMNEMGMSVTKDTWATVTFNNIQLMEEELRKDLAEFTAEEVGESLVTTGVISAATVMNRIPLVVRYKNWCAEQGFQAVIVQSDEIHTDMTDNIRDTMVYAPSELLWLMNKAFPDKGVNSSNCVYRSYLWMGFAGMHPEDAASVRSADVEIRHRMIFYNGRQYAIPEEGVHDIVLACKSKSFTRMIRGGLASFEREDNDRILRGRKLKKEISIHAYVRSTLRPVIQKGFQAIGYNGMSFLRIRKSGIFYTMFSTEVRGLPVNFAAAAFDDYAVGSYKESKGNPKQKVVRRLMLMYEKDYAAWKNAFEKELMEEFDLKEMPRTEE